MAGNKSINQRSAFSGKSLEYNGMLIRSEGHSGEFIVVIQKQYDDRSQTEMPSSENEK